MIRPAPDEPLEQIELDLLLQALFRRFGLDLRQHARPALERRIRQAVADEQLESISALQARILHDAECMERLVRSLSLNATSMFRDPEVYRAFRQKVIPWLRTYPSLRIWHAGCSSGEETYSMAILLHEEGLLSRTSIHATDMSETLVRSASKGVFPIQAMRDYATSYVEAGGTTDLARYYTVRYENAILADFLRESITFSQHSLAVDGPFNEFNAILYRNVGIYFNHELQERAHDLIYQSLAPFGVLVLGRRESIELTKHESSYEAIDLAERMFRRID